LFNQIGKFRHMFGDTLSMPLVARCKVAMGSGYGSQHSMDPAGLYALFPGWRIVAPTTPFDYVGLMNAALTSEDPVLVIEHLELYASEGPGPVDDYGFHVPLGKAKVVRPGGTLTVVTYLAMVERVRAMVDRLGIDAEIIDLRSLDRAGLDWETIGASVRKTGALVVAEQGPLTASYGQIVADEAQRRLFDWLDAPVLRIHGGEASPTISRALEMAAITDDRRLEAGLRRALAEIGRDASAVAE
jgi:2-oxoisovalerate dehydrogenase E1 component